jgi:hypothetical protein
MSVTTAAKRSIADFIASVKQASEHETDEGTSHPVSTVDAGTQPAAEGARSAENAADTVAAIGTPAVDEEDDATDQVGTDSAAEDHLQIGTKKAPTGEDPSVETASTNATLSDPGTSHPASTDNPDLGSKYASMSTRDLTKVAADLANQLLASDELATALQLSQSRGQASQPQQSKEAEDAAQAGWDLAGLVAGDFDKQAVDAALVARMEDIIKTAAHDADNVIEYLTAYANQKQAMAMPPAAEMGGEMGGGMGGGMGGMPSELTPEMAAALMQQMGGEGEMPMAPAEEPSIEEIIQMLLASGVSPEELMAAMGAAGASPPAMPAGDMAAGAMTPGGLEVEASANANRSQPGSATKSAQPANEELKQAMASYFQELVARNRKA